MKFYGSSGYNFYVTDNILIYPKDERTQRGGMKWKRGKTSREETSRKHDDMTMFPPVYFVRIIELELSIAAWFLHVPLAQRLYEILSRVVSSGGWCEYVHFDFPSFFILFFFASYGMLLVLLPNPFRWLM